MGIDFPGGIAYAFDEIIRNQEEYYVICLLSEMQYM